jgi:DNA invertase Pin-like site-specific DNA recombinase
MKIGYARVSTQDQELSLQLDALEEVGCRQIYREKMSGSTKERPQLHRMMAQLREGDTVVIWKLDRLARSIKDMVSLVNEIQEKGGALHSLNDQIDTTTPHGKFTFHIFAALAEFERNLIRERTKAGLVAARARGKKGGRRKALDEEKTQRLYKLYGEANADGSRKYVIKEICEMMGVSRSSLYRYLEQREVSS